MVELGLPVHVKRRFLCFKVCLLQFFSLSQSFKRTLALAVTDNDWNFQFTLTFSSFWRHLGSLNQIVTKPKRDRMMFQPFVLGVANNHSIKFTGSHLSGRLVRFLQGRGHLNGFEYHCFYWKLSHWWKVKYCCGLSSPGAANSSIITRFLNMQTLWSIFHQRVFSQ
jgi:hypothetical protein